MMIYPQNIDRVTFWVKTVNYVMFIFNQKFFWALNSFQPKIFWAQNIFETENLLNQIFGPEILFGPKIFGGKIFF